ncbi:MAG: glutamyl-tRNA reductase [Caldisericia bacterium]|nr:glutamyl-tRNA reductase [Caldisericia bacterium]
MREKISSLESNSDGLYKTIMSSDHIRGCVLLYTCNRFEIYISTDQIEIAKNFLQTIFFSSTTLSPEEFYQCFVEYQCIQAVEHLFHVAAGLDSLLLGEDQILHQIRNAYQKSVDIESADKVLHSLFQTAIHVGKKVRTNTEINQHSLSYPGLCADICKEKFSSFRDCNILVLGSGEMATDVVKTLLKKDPHSITVACRNPQKMKWVQDIDSSVNIVLLQHVHTIIHTINIVISCIKTDQPFLTKETIASLELQIASQPRVFIDLSVPRSISPDVEAFPGIELIDMDTLATRIQNAMKNRTNEIQKVSHCIQEELQSFSKWFQTKHMDSTIQALKDFSESIKNKELSRAIRRFGTLTEIQERILTDLAHSITYGILHYPIEEAKNHILSTGHSMDSILLLRQLFHLEALTKSEYKKNTTILDAPKNYD